MIKLSDRINRMEESATLAMSRKSRELKSQGKDVISLSLGEPDFHTPDFIKEAAKQAIDENYTTYTPVPGYDDLREAICRKFHRDNGLTFTKDQIVVSTGAKQSIANVMMSLLNPGDEVIIPAPYWVSYYEIVKVAGGTPVIVGADIEKDFKFTGEDIEPYINSKTKALIFSTPCNPTGSVYSKEELKSIADVLVKHKQVVAISDEIYEHINFKSKHESLAQFEEIYEQVVTINGVSKAWSMTGWRLGYIGAPKLIADACTKVQGQFTSATCSITQRAAIAALDKDPAFLKSMINAFESRKKLVYDYLKSMEGVKVNDPEGAFYFFPDISSFFGKKAGDRMIDNATDISMYVLEEANLALVTGEAFGGPNCIRISYATDEETLKIAMQRLGDALKNIK
mgnify:CR=1 FL=1